MGTFRANSDGATFWDSTPLPELHDLYKNVYRNARKYFSHEYLESLSPLAVALWYQDDGSFTLRGKREDRGRVAICIEAMDEQTRERLIESLWWRFGVQGRLTEVRDMAILRFEQPATDRLHAVIAPFVHPSMQYKLLPQYRGRFAVEPQLVDPERRLVPAAIASIHPKPPTGNGRRRYRYDLEVAGTHNYLVDGVVVHNSPETTSGGKALKFYASIRLDIRPIEPIKNGTEIIGRRVRVKVVKNKVSPPFRIAELEILAAEGISREGGLIDMGVTTGVLDKSGAWINYGKQRIGQGREAAKQFLREHADVANEVEQKVRERSGAAAIAASPDGEEG